MQIGHREEFLVLWKLFTVAILPLETQFIQPNYLVILSHLRSTTGSLETNSYIPLSQCPSPTLSTPPFCGNLVSQTENSEITVSSLLAKLSYWTFLGQAYFNLREKKKIFCRLWVTFYKHFTKYCEEENIWEHHRMLY